MGLIIHVNFMVKFEKKKLLSNVCVTYAPWIQWLFCAGATLTGSHYRTYIISGVGHLRSDSFMPLVLWMVVYNIWGTCVVL
jgi:hypothetical protein